MPDALEESKIGTLLKLMKICKNAKSQKGEKKKVLLKDNRVRIHNTGSNSDPVGWTSTSSANNSHSSRFRWLRDPKTI
ncbi:hypothetical protein HYC85_030060 [Camellia sinensis]|uniref:Uncharacterized protein n=1 Tax=Camellia sinensis TaxID=4442 RepID=A0A7J7FZU4_CAMSI|nr:hypothetical protein HYC85_030060 [Camellia sinensis]